MQRVGGLIPPRWTIARAMWHSLIGLVMVAYLPGALIFRAPLLDRDRRAALPAEERAFWAVVISLALSLAVVLALAAAGAYRYGRLIFVDLACAAAVAAWSRGRLRLGPGAARPTWTLLVPLALVALGTWRFFPPAEYVIGGKDPGVYMNEGIQIAQRGRLVLADPVVASVPEPSRDLFFPSHRNPTYYGVRFMGFFILDPKAGTVVGQFPHLFPASIAIGYGLDGLTGARRAIGVWGVLGLLAVYFAGARIVGRAAAAAAAALLGLHVLQVWFARYPNAELVMQALLFAALLAVARGHVDNDRFFVPLAGALLALLLFLRFDIVLAYVAVAAGLVLTTRISRRPFPWLMVGVFGVGVLAGWIYLTGPMAPYAAFPFFFLRNAGLGGFVLLGVIALGVFLWSTRSSSVVERIQTFAPTVLIVVVVAAAIYGEFLRQAGGRLAEHDAAALRTFVQFYLTMPGLLAALVGVVLTVRRSLWKDPSLILTIVVFALFFFYKLRIVPEHFWAGRRFLPVVLPGALLFLSSAALTGTQLRWRVRPLVHLAIGVVFLGLLARRYDVAAQPILGHVEYAGVIARLEQLTGRFGDTDLVLVESRSASDAHVLALPLAYIYARNVIVLNTPRPDKTQFREFLEWARTRYRDVYFVGGGGTDLLSRTIGVSAVASERFQVPEYESLLNTYPRLVRHKEFDFGIYRFERQRELPAWFALDVGERDDLHVLRFHAKERTGDGDVSFRWTRDVSYISVLGIHADSHIVMLWLNDGGRPPGVEPAIVTVYLDDHLLGQTVVTSGFLPYTFAIPPEVAEAAAARDEPARLRLLASTWNPREALGSSDDRELGVMVDRVEVR